MEMVFKILEPMKEVNVDRKRGLRTEPEVISVQLSGEVRKNSQRIGVKPGDCDILEAKLSKAEIYSIFSFPLIKSCWNAHEQRCS